MKFAAKRTWPEKASSWEHEGDAESAEGFALEFATIEQLAAESELVVMTKEGGSPTTAFFKVTATSPYAVETAEPKTAAAPESASQEGADEASQAPAGMPSLSPVISMILYMGKVAVIATLAIALMGVGITYLKSLLG